MRYLLLKLILISSFFSFAQSSMDFHIGGIVGTYAYKDYVKFGDTYNAVQANNTTLEKPLKMKTLATGVQIGSTFNYEEWVYGSIDLSRVKTAVSKAKFDSEVDRGFQIRSFSFDMDAGFYVIPATSPVRLSVGFGITFISTKIHAFIDYGKARSYGTENTLNGVYASWKGYTPIVLKLSYLKPESHWKFYVDARIPLQAKKLSSIGYIYSAEFTSEGHAFPADYGGSWGDQNKLSENFRLINVALGIAYHFEFY